MPKQDKEVVIHTLLTREIRPIKNWHEWLACWQRADNLQIMEGLLHVGFNVSIGQVQYDEKKYDEMDRYIFYLTIADGWADHYLLQLPGDGYNSEKKTPSELRQQLAHKAFDMLCLNLFKIELSDDCGDAKFNWVWERFIVSEKLFPVIQNFFRVERGRFADHVIIRNLFRIRGERSHNEQQAVNFLLNLAKFIWGWKEPDNAWAYPKKDEEEKCITETRIRVDIAKPWMIEMLSQLSRLDLLIQEWILKFDEPCLAKLKEIAMRNKVWYPHHPFIDRPVATLDEACYAGSKAAWLLKKHELMVKEHVKLEAIVEAERQRAEADRKLKELNGK